jgi:sensor histidine kinase YesM
LLRIGRHVAFWIVAQLFFTLMYFTGYYGIDGKDLFSLLFVLGYSFLETLVFLPVHLLLTYTILKLVIPSFTSGKYWLMLLWLSAAMVVAHLLFFYLTWQVIVPVRIAYNIPVAHTGRYFLSSGLLGGLRGGVLIAGVAGIVELAKHWYLKNRLAQQLEADNLRAELQLLKAQIHPHFLFNTLNNLYSLTLQQSPQAPGVVVKISSLLRHMLYECNKPTISLEREVQMLQDYIHLEKARYGGRLEISVSISGEMNGKVVAPLLLMPFLENSFKHGASDQLEQAWISLELVVEGKHLRMKLMNGLLSTEESGEIVGQRTAGGIGLENVKKRLNLVYPQRHELKILQEEEIFMVSLVLELDDEWDEKALSNQESDHFMRKSVSTHHG